MIGYALAPLFFIALTEFLLLRSAYKDIGDLTQENAALKVTNRKLSENLRISSRPAVKLDESIARMHNGQL